jgi:DNA-directed RNA polymerase subunit RPC12/RpoP
MADFLSLSCPSCGGKLQITSDIERFACSYCGTEQIVKRGGGIISLTPVIDGLKNIKVGVDKTSSELALIRLNREILELENSIRVSLTWFTGRISNTTHIKPGMNIDVLLKIIEYEIEQNKIRAELNPTFANPFYEFTHRFNSLKTLVFGLREKQAEVRKHKEIVSQ